MSDLPRLKCCPFCGGEAWLNQGGGARCHPWARVDCRNVHCSASSKHVTDYSGETQVATAIRAWNLRSSKRRAAK